MGEIPPFFIGLRLIRASEYSLYDYFFFDPDFP